MKISSRSINIFNSIMNKMNRIKNINIIIMRKRIRSFIRSKMMKRTNKKRVRRSWYTTTFILKSTFTYIIFNTPTSIIILMISINLKSPNYIITNTNLTINHKIIFYIITNYIRGSIILYLHFIKLILSLKLIVLFSRTILL